MLKPDCFLDNYTKVPQSTNVTYFPNSEYSIIIKCPLLHV